MHIHVLMLCRKFELIPIKIGFLRIFKVAIIMYMYYYPDEEAEGLAAFFKQREEPDPNEDNDVHK